MHKAHETELTERLPADQNKTFHFLPTTCMSQPTRAQSCFHEAQNTKAACNPQAPGAWPTPNPTHCAGQEVRWLLLTSSTLSRCLPCFKKKGDCLNSLSSLNIFITDSMLLGFELLFSSSLQLIPTTQLCWSHHSTYSSPWAPRTPDLKEAPSSDGPVSSSET